MDFRWGYFTTGFENAQRMEDNFRPDNHLLNKVLLYSGAYTNAQFCSPRGKDAFQKATIVQNVNRAYVI